jgi:hypothetical protein
VELGNTLRDQEDQDILTYALGFLDDQDASPGLRLAAGAVMMCQLGIGSDQQGRPAWWDESNTHELDHPAIIEAVKRTRNLLGQGAGSSNTNR